MCFPFRADEDLARLAGEVCGRVNPEIKVFRGRVVSGDQFIADKEKKEYIVKNLPGALHGDGGGGDCPDRLSKRPAFYRGAGQFPIRRMTALPWIILLLRKKAAEHSVNLIEGLLEAMA